MLAFSCAQERAEMMVTLGPGGLKIIILHNCLYLRCRLGYLHVLDASKYLAMESLVEPGLHMGLRLVLSPHRSVVMESPFFF